MFVHISNVFYVYVRTTWHLQKKEEIGHSIGNSTERKGKDKIYVRVRFNICQTCRTSTFLLKIRNLCESKSFCVTILHENMILRRNGVFCSNLVSLGGCVKYWYPNCSVRPKPNIRPKFSARSAEIFGRKFRPTCRIFGQVKKCGK